MERTLAPKRQIEALPIIARTTAASPHNSADIRTMGRKGLIAFLSVTLDPDTVSITVKIQGQDMNGAYYDIPGADFGAVADVGDSILSIYPGVAETANEAVSDILPEVIRVVSTHTGGTTMTYGVTLEFKE